MSIFTLQIPKGAPKSGIFEAFAEKIHKSDRLLAIGCFGTGLGFGTARARGAFGLGRSCFIRIRGLSALPALVGNVKSAALENDAVAAVDKAANRLAAFGAGF